MNKKMLEEQILYGFIKEKDRELPIYWYYDIGVAIKQAKKETMDREKYFILKKTEHYDIVEVEE